MSWSLLEVAKVNFLSKSEIRLPWPWQPWQSWHQIACRLKTRHRRKSLWYRLSAESKKDLRWCTRCGKIETRIGKYGRDNLLDNPARGRAIDKERS